MNQEQVKLSELFAQLTTDELYRRLRLYENFKFENFSDVLSYHMINRELDSREFFNKTA